MKDKVSAKLELYKTDTWSDKGRKEIAAWLRKQADALVKEGKQYSGNFTARYISVVEE